MIRKLVLMSFVFASFFIYGIHVHAENLNSEKVRFNLEGAKNPHVTVISDKEATYTDDGVVVNVKVSEDYYTDSTGKRVDGEKARMLVRNLFEKNPNWVEVRYTSTGREVTGEGKEIIRLNNNDSDASLHWSKTETHTFSTKLSTSGEFNLSKEKQKLGFDLGGSWTTTVTFTIDVGPRKAAILYLNPVGTEYTMHATQFSDYSTPMLIGSGKWTNWTKTEYKTVAY